MNNESLTSVDSSSGKLISTKTDSEEYCYRGVVYVKFDNGLDTKTSWGGVKFTPEGKVATCVASPN